MIISSTQNKSHLNIEHWYVTLQKDNDRHQEKFLHRRKMTALLEDRTRSDFSSYMKKFQERLIYDG